jgi:putative transposase
MSAAVSEATGKRYGVKRVCDAWGAPRSSFYQRQRLDGDPKIVLLKRGPKTPLSDEALLVMIREDLAKSPFTGEGHRKVWARLRFRDGVRVSRKRVLRLMREAKLLSPHRHRQGRAKSHEGTITTTAPNQLWGTDGTKVFTLKDGWVWIFTAVEHWNAECVGWHVCKRGDRFNALEPLSMALMKHYGSVKADAARGLSLRMDHGSQYLSDHFLKQIKFWGIAESFAFVEEPQTNGVAERFFRTLKEQAIYGRTFYNLEEVREAVRTFVNRYNAEWLVEKLGHQSPQQARTAWFAQMAA